MRKVYKNYFLLSLLVIIIGLIVGNCGGGDDTGAVPDVSGNSTQTQNLVSKDVSGFVYATSSLSSSKDGEEEETSFSILDIPLSGEEGFIAQVNEYIQEDTSSKRSSPETEELLTAFTEETSQYQPLPVWNSAANIYSSYADSLSTSPIPITSEGEISGSVLVDASDDLVSLDIEVAGEECYETEAISSSDLLNSSDASGEYVLKSCPKKIIIKPGDCKVFKVFSKPSVNLSELGLQFSLVNPELGTVCGPIFLRCNGAKKYSVSYGVIYAKKNVETPIDTAINVSTTQGQSLILPVQIVKKTAVVSGKIYAGGSIVKGFVISQGPKSQCKINADGTYSLPKVWQGTGRKITATWWIMNGNQKVRYRETKFVDVFGDMTVDFGVILPTPVPTRLATDPYYGEIVSKVIEKKWEWESELGFEQGVQKTVDWLNNNVPDDAVPDDIADGIAEARVDDYNSRAMRIYFTDGLTWYLAGQEPWNNISSDLVPQNKVSYNKFDNLQDNVSLINNNIRNASTVKNDKILMLCPYMWEIMLGKELPEQEIIKQYSVYYDIGEKLESYGYAVTRSAVEKSGFVNIVFGPDDPLDADESENADILFYTQKDWTKLDIDPQLICHINKNNPNRNIITFEDYLELDQYGVIYIRAHGYPHGIACFPYYENDEDLETWLNNNKGLWEYKTSDYPAYWGGLYSVKNITLKKEFFDRFNFGGSLVFINACSSFAFYENGGFSNAKVYLGYDQNANLDWTFPQSYYYFLYMIDKFSLPSPDDMKPLELLPPGETPYYPYAEDPLDPPLYPDPSLPMSAAESYRMIDTIGANPDRHDFSPGHPLEKTEGCRFKMSPDPYLTENDVYFPVPTTITITQE